MLSLSSSSPSPANRNFDKPTSIAPIKPCSAIKLLPLATRVISRSASSQIAETNGASRTLAPLATQAARSSRETLRQESLADAGSNCRSHPISSDGGPSSALSPFNNSPHSNNIPNSPRESPSSPFSTATKLLRPWAPLAVAKSGSAAVTNPPSVASSSTSKFSPERPEVDSPPGAASHTAAMKPAD